MFLEKYAELKVELNTQTRRKETIFHWACCFGNSKVVNILMKKSDNFKIDLNAKNDVGHTAFHYACMYGSTKVVEMMIENAETSKIDLKTKTGKTALQIAKMFRRYDIVNVGHFEH